MAWLEPKERDEDDEPKPKKAPEQVITRMPCPVMLHDQDTSKDAKKGGKSKKKN